MKNIILFALMSLLSLSVYGSVEPPIKPIYGKTQTIKFRPMNSPLNFEYDVVYYIPESLKDKKDLPTLIFLHGGGESTNTRRGSLKVIKQYTDDLKRLADEIGFVLVMPSGSALNWGLHAISYLKDLNIALKHSLPINSDRIALAGHSMGGMGITRMYQWMADEYAFFLPIAAGLETKNATSENLRSLFNIRYHHLQGRYDHFKVFVTRSLEQEKKVRLLEEELGIKSGFTLEIYDGDHNYIFHNLKSNLETLFKENSRNLYQRKLYGNISNINETVTDRWSNMIEYYKGPRERYFWLKGIKFSDKSSVVNLSAEIENNTIKVSTTEGLKTLRIYLDTKLVDITRSIEIIINDEIKFQGIPSIQRDAIAEANDPSYKFETYIDLNL